MRKQLKKKRRSCSMCKPHKMGWVNRWKPKEKLKEIDKKDISSSIYVIQDP